MAGGNRFSRMEDDVGQLRRQSEDGARKARRLGEDHVVIESPRKLLLRSPNGHYWDVQISNAGTVTLVDIGTEL